MWSERPSRRIARVRGLISIFSGAAGVNIGGVQGLWLRERLSKTREVSEEEDFVPRLWGGVSRRLRETRTLNAALFVDTDPGSEKVYRRIERIFSKLGIPTTWVKIPGPTAAQNPASLYGRLKEDERAKKTIAEAFEKTISGIDMEYVQAVELLGSMHGSGAATNVYVAEHILPSLGKELFKVVLAVNADISRVITPLDYLESTRWTLGKYDELLKKELIDTVIMIDNTLASAVKAVQTGLASKEELARAWKILLRNLDLNDTYSAVEGFYAVTAKLAKYDPHETNDLIVQATVPLTIIPSWGQLIVGGERELRAASAPWDYYNIKRATAGKYIIPGYLPGELLRKIDFDAIVRELSLAMLAPVDPLAVESIIVVLGEEDKSLWESRGIHMYTLLEEGFVRQGFNGPIDVLTVLRESGMWIFTICNNTRLLEAKFELRPWR